MKYPLAISPSATSLDGLPRLTPALGTVPWKKWDIESDIKDEDVGIDELPESELLAFSSPPRPAEPSEDGQQDFDNGIWQILQRKDPWQRVNNETNNICI